MQQTKLTRAEQQDVERIYAEHVFGGLEAPPDPETARRNQQRELHQRGQAALRQAERASTRGDQAGAKRWTDTANRIVASWRALDEMPLPPSDHEEEERLRAELRARLKKAADGEHEMLCWRIRREIWEEMAASAAAVGAPPPAPLPPRPPHWTDAVPAEVRTQLGYD